MGSTGHPIGNPVVNHGQPHSSPRQQPTLFVPVPFLTLWLGQIHHKSFSPTTIRPLHTHNHPPQQWQHAHLAAQTAPQPHTVQRNLLSMATIGSRQLQDIKAAVDEQIRASPLYLLSISQQLIVRGADPDEAYNLAENKKALQLEVATRLGLEHYELESILANAYHDAADEFWSKGVYNK